jgi:acetolactate synthase-1/2/3 large subunit
LRNPDFAALAKSHGMEGFTVARTEQFAPAFDAARAMRRPALIEIVTDPEAITPTTTLSAIRASALSAQGTSA